MHVEELETKGLVRRIHVVFEASEITAELEKRLGDLSHQVNLPGFRPGKAPMSMMRSRYGKPVMQDILQDKLVQGSQEALGKKGLRAATQPRTKVAVFDETKGLDFEMEVEVIPSIEPIDFRTLSFERMMAEIDEAEVDTALAELARRQRASEPVIEPRPAVKGDIVVIDFHGSVDGVAREDMHAHDFQLELGSHSFVDTFEDQLVGSQPGDKRQVRVTFPQDYRERSLAGKPADFDVEIKELRQPHVKPVDDALAQEYGMENLEALRQRLRERISENYKIAARQKLKVALFDKLATEHHFELPPTMVEREAESIWQDWKRRSEKGQVSPEDAGKSEETLRAEFRTLGERRVRLGLLLDEVGQRHKIHVGEHEFNSALMREAGYFPGGVPQAVQFYREHPQLADQMIRAPLYEEKVVDFILSLATITDKKVPVSELLQEDESGDDGHVHTHAHGHSHDHDHDHGHDHAHGHEH